MCGQAGHNTQPHARSPSSFLGKDAWMTSQLKVAFIHKLRGSSMCMAHFSDMLSIGVCRTRHFKTSGRLVQELNICTVATNDDGHFHEIYFSLQKRDKMLQLITAFEVILLKGIPLPLMRIET